MKRYLAYKNSGVDWMGEIPKAWEIIPLKRLTQVKRGASPRPIEDPKYFDENGEFGWVRIADVTASERYLENTTQKLSELGASLSVKRYPGDLFLSIAGTVGKPIISRIKCCIHDGFVWFPDLKINPEFLYYIFSAGLAYQGLGKLGTQLNLNTDTVGYIKLPLPSQKEICQIVKYLDSNTAKIDFLINQKQKLIDLLKEERSVVIEQAVTKGIDSNIEMKESGMDWLGKIPKHWKIKRLKYICSTTKGYAFKGTDFVDNGVPVVKASDIKNESINDINIFIDDELASKHKNVELNSGNIILSTVGSTPDVIASAVGQIAIVPEKLGKSLLNQNTVRFDLNKEVVINKEFFFSILRSNSFRKYLDLYAHGTANQASLSLDDILNYKIALPPYTEQEKISEHIIYELLRIDKAIKKIQIEIDLLQEYRTALISEVVTGKIDVREEVVSWI